MTSTIRRAGLALLFLLFPVFALASEPSAPAKATLDGKTFTGEMKDPSGKADKDDFVFANGTFTSTGCTPYGFKAEKYEAKGEGDAIAFTAKATSPKEGTMDWSGKAKGDTIEGKALWTKDGKTSEYTFKGTLKK